ncbi:MAG: DivIVA domain-containing protein [Ruminococcus sp.]|nr:DivIVA domain-containing protein [Ruminococcus sp.]
MLSIEEIKNISFRKASLGGYKPEDVDAFIDQVLITMEQMRKEKSDLVKKMDFLATRVEEYRADEDAVRNALLSAQRVADSTIKEARAKAAYIIEESENVAKAKLYDLNIQIKQQKKQYTMLLAECNKLREDIINNCNKHMVIAKDLPGLDKIKSMEASMDKRYPTDNSDDFEKAGEIGSKTKAPAATTEEHRNFDRIIIDEPQESVDTVPAAEDTKKTAPAASASAEKKTDAKPVTDSKSTAQADVPVIDIADNDYEEVNIVSDLGDREFSNEFIAKKEKKKGRAFGVLKFGDDYDLNNDDDDSNAVSDNR